MTDIAYWWETTAAKDAQLANNAECHRHAWQTTLRGGGVCITCGTEVNGDEL